ncbi:MAG: hypothetical protein K2H11_02130 [Malacoplasma sp.]|nr:hypothetical protein [Malacoplasma sp.]
MHINKLFKKIIKPAFLFCPVVCIPFISTACQTTGTKSYYVNSEWECYGSIFKFESVDYKLIENDLEIKVSIATIPSKQGLRLDGYLSSRYYFTTLPNKEKSTEESGFDITETIYSKQTYIFVYYISISTLNDLKKEYDYLPIENNKLCIPFQIYILGPYDIEFKINILEFIDNSTKN